MDCRNQYGLTEVLQSVPAVVRSIVKVLREYRGREDSGYLPTYLPNLRGFSTWEKLTAKAFDLYYNRRSLFLFFFCGTAKSCPSSTGQVRSTDYGVASDHISRQGLNFSRKVLQAS